MIRSESQFVVNSDTLYAWIEDAINMRLDCPEGELAVLDVVFSEEFDEWTVTLMPVTLLLSETEVAAPVKWDDADHPVEDPNESNGFDGSYADDYFK